MLDPLHRQAEHPLATVSSRLESEDVKEVRPGQVGNPIATGSIGLPSKEGKTVKYSVIA